MLLFIFRLLYKNGGAIHVTHVALCKLEAAGLLIPTQELTYGMSILFQVLEAVIAKTEKVVRAMPKVTKADLAFIDAAIAAHKAVHVKTTDAMIGVDSSSHIACDPVDVAALVVAAAIIAYKAYNSCLMGQDTDQMMRVQKLGVAPTVSLDRLIASRNQLAEALHEPAIH